MHTQMVKSFMIIELRLATASPPVVAPTLPLNHVRRLKRCQLNTTKHSLLCVSVEACRSIRPLNY